MQSTIKMNVEERLDYVRSLRYKDEKQKALKREMNKRKRQESGNSINSSISTTSNNQENLSPLNKKRRSEITKLGVLECNGNQPNTTYQYQTKEDLNSSLDTSQQIKKG